MIIADALRDTEDRHEMTKHSISLSLPPSLLLARTPPPLFPLATIAISACKFQDKQRIVGSNEMLPGMLFRRALTH